MVASVSSMRRKKVSAADGLSRPMWGRISSASLFCREIDDGIELWRVIHGRRNIPRLLNRYGGEGD